MLMTDILPDIMLWQMLTWPLAPNLFFTKNIQHMISNGRLFGFFIRNNTGYRRDKTILGKSEIREILVIHNCLHKYFVNTIQLLVNSK